MPCARPAVRVPGRAVPRAVWELAVHGRGHAIPSTSHGSSAPADGRRRPGSVRRSPQQVEARASVRKMWHLRSCIAGDFVVRTLRGVAFRDVALAFRELRMAVPASRHGIPAHADASRACAHGSRTCTDGGRACAHGTATGRQCHFRARKLDAHRASIGKQGAGTLVRRARAKFPQRCYRPISAERISSSRPKYSRNACSS